MMRIARATAVELGLAVAATAILATAAARADTPAAPAYTRPDLILIGLPHQSDKYRCHDLHTGGSASPDVWLFGGCVLKGVLK